MPQMKFFKGLESDLAGLERKINTWMMEPGIRVINVFGNIAPKTSPVTEPTGTLVTQSGYGDSDVLIAVLYEKL
jgi:hypothetical protein